MTAPSPRPKRRWRRWAVIVAAIAVGIGLLSYRNGEQQRAEHDWLSMLNAGSVMARLTKRTGINFLDQFSVARRLGRHHLSVVVMNDDDARHILSIADCPMPIHIFTTPRASTGLIDRIRDRYGAENVDGASSLD